MYKLIPQTILTYNRNLRTSVKNIIHSSTCNQHTEFWSSTTQFNSRVMTLPSTTDSKQQWGLNTCLHLLTPANDIAWSGTLSTVNHSKLPWDIQPALVLRVTNPVTNIASNGPQWSLLKWQSWQTVLQLLYLPAQHNYFITQRQNNRHNTNILRW